MKKIIRNIILIAIIVIIGIIFLWRVPIYIQLKSVNLPENSQDVRTIINISDVHELHFEGMRIIYCDDGYEAVKEYAEKNNSENKFKRIKVLPFFADYEFNSDYYVQADDNEKYKYVLIRYYKEIK